MDLERSDELGPRKGAAGVSGWFAFAPDGARGVTRDEIVRTVSLRADEYAGPFWDETSHLSDDFDALHTWIGISRELFDDAMAWGQEFADQRGADEAWPACTRPEEKNSRGGWPPSSAQASSWMATQTPHPP